MADSTTTLQDLKDRVAQFIDEREWNQFHSPKNLVMNLSCEVAEIMEHFLWMETNSADQAYQENRIEIEHEVADVGFALLALCNRLGVDLSDIMERKIAIQAQKYPIHLAKGNSAKYTKLKNKPGE